MTQISLVLTVRNEAENLPRLLDSVLAQTLQPAEVVIVDGGSTDGTQAVVRSYMDRLPLCLLIQPGANISQGRNTAIRIATCDIVAVTDAGVRLDPGWLEALASHFGMWNAECGMGNPHSAFHTPHSVDVASGFFVADPKTPFETAMGATVLPAIEDIDPQTFLPSSRSVAFRKAAWKRAGGYPEWLDYCEDLVFDLRLRKTGHDFVFVPEAIAWFRPRSNLRDFYLQYYRYARGDGKADLWRKRHAIRYLTYAVGPVGAVWAWRHRRSTVGKLLLASFGLAAFGYCRRPYARLLRSEMRVASSEHFHSRLATQRYELLIYALALVPVIRLTGDIAKMLGYPVGVIWRLRLRKRL